MKIEKEIIVDKSIDNAWQVLGPQFAEAHKWASPVNHSEPKGVGINGSTCSERSCDTTMGGLKEKILKYSEQDYLLSFHAYQGMPSVVKEAISTWKLNKLGSDKTKLNVCFDIKLGGMMGFFMQPMMKMMMSKMGTTLIHDFKYYVENGKPSETKIKAVKKYKV